MQNQRDYVTVVTGLPRSGTSMMMRMLDEGGMPVTIDGERVADEDNPGGYYEFEAVKRTTTDPGWVKDSVGHAVKMVYRLMRDMPPEFRYRVLFMRRPIEEVLASQRKMMQRNENLDEVDDAVMADLFSKQLADFEVWLAAQRNIDSIEVSYHDVLASTERQAKIISDFLDGLDVDAMVAVIDPRLYRNRS